MIPIDCEDPDEEYHIQTFLQQKEHARLVERIRSDPGSKLKVRKTSDGTFTLEIIHPAREAFWEALLVFLIIGVGAFVLLGWLVALLYQYVFGPAPLVETTFPLRGIIFGTYVCLSHWYDESLWTELSQGYRVTWSLFVVLILSGVVLYEIVLDDVTGMLWLVGLLVVHAYNSATKGSS